MIRLRPWKREELTELLDWFSDEESFSKWSAGKFAYPLTKEQLLEYYDRFEKDKNGWIFAALDDRGKLVGHIMMRNADYARECVHFGFIAVSPETRGRGTGRLMLTQALRYAGEVLGMKRATLGVFANNPAAKRCYEAVGFKAERVEDDAYEFRGEKWAVIHMAADLRGQIFGE